MFLQVNSFSVCLGRYCQLYISVNVGDHLHIHAISPTTVPEKASMIEHYEITSEVISLAEQHIIPCIGRLFISLAEILILVQTVS